ncbi:hypothetical protein G7Y79_00043g079550 [Physcia stellaris]|nr:hypothetical protein G7Y79_00043g079550 [Physcia stellaris]
MADQDTPDVGLATSTALGAAAAIEPEVPASSDSDSGYGDLTDDSSYTTSIASSITNYKYEHGRRYHAYQEGRYILPNDEQEQERLDIQYHAVRLAYGDKTFLAPITDPQRVLDVGTGTGIWAMDFADLYPNAEFEVDDLEQQWTFPPDHFDFIHGRILNASVRDWPRHCKPGGWMEAQEISVDAKTDDNSFPEDSLIRRWCELQEEAAQNMGITLLLSGEGIKEHMENAGFQNVEVRGFKIPIGPWPADKKLKEVGIFQLAGMLEGMESLTLALWTRYLGWDEKEVAVFLTGVKKEWRSAKVHSYWPLYSVYGQKPTSA